MNRYKGWVEAWQDIAGLVEEYGGTVTGPVIGRPATEEEICTVEARLNAKLPNSFRKVLAEFSGSVCFNWFLPEEVGRPEAFEEIFSGEVFWDIDRLENLDELALQAEDDTLRGAIQFMTAGNGDVLAFGRDEDGERPILYWSHEGEGTFLLGRTYGAYMENFTTLHCVGSEYWQMEPFLDDDGLNASGDAAVEWKTFVAYLKELSHCDLESPEQVLEYVQVRGELTDRVQGILERLPASGVANAVERCLEEEPVDEEVLYRVLMRVHPQKAAHRVRGLWEENWDGDPELRSLLTAVCLPVDEGLPMVFNYAEAVYDGQSHVMESHMVHFSDSRVIDRIRDCVTDKATKDDWYSLFARSNPRWNQITDWLSLGGKHRMVAIQALDFIVRYGVPEKAGEPYRYRITAVPEKQVMVQRLQEEQERELLNTKKKIFAAVLEAIEELTRPD